jgi:hypothetical protein
LSLVLASGVVDPLNINLIKIKTFPRYERHNLDNVIHTTKEFPPVFKDLDLIKLKAPCYYKIRGYTPLPIPPLNTYVPIVKPIEFSTEYTLEKASKGL